MFTQIQLAIEKLRLNIEEEIDYVATMRQNDNNNPTYIEKTGRIVGLTYALTEVDRISLEINEHIADILKNTTDGNYASKVTNLEDENEILREKIELLEDDLRKYNVSSKKKKKSNKLPSPIEELSENEIDKILTDEMETNSRLNGINYDDSDEE